MEYQEILLTRAQAASLLHVSARTIINYEARRILNSRKIGRRVLIPRSEIDRALKLHRSTTA
jgi:excisionase family DNA binding protein